MNTRKTFWAVVVCLLVLASLSPISCSGEKESKDSAKAPATFAALITLEASEEMEVPLLFENTSRAPIKYLMANDAMLVSGLDFALYRDGTRVEREYFPSPARLGKEKVKELKAGESIQPRLKLNYFYGELKPGRYELRLHYKIPEDSGLVTDYGVTPMSFEYRVYVQITEAKKKP